MNILYFIGGIISVVIYVKRSYDEKVYDIKVGYIYVTWEAIFVKLFFMGILVYIFWLMYVGFLIFL